MNTLSKYVLAEIIDFLPEKEILPIRELSQRYRIAVSYIWSRRIKQISQILTSFQKDLESSFTSKELTKYRSMFTQSSLIQKEMSKNAKIVNECNYIPQ